MLNRAILLGCVAMCAFLPQVYAAETAGTPVDPAQLSVPTEAGHVVSRHLDVPEANGRLVLHIQDAHTNYSAQKNLATIIDDLAKKYQIELILVEGGVENASLSYLREYGTPEKRLEVAERFLKNGEISGEEYLDLIADYPLTLWGVESEELYNANLSAFLDSEKVQDAVTPAVQQLRDAIDAVAERKYPQSLKQLVAAKEAYESGDLSFGKYLAQLNELLKEAWLTLDAYPALVAFREAQRIERALDMDKVQKEQTLALNFLKAALEPSELEPLMNAGRAMQSGRGNALAFYTELQRLLDASQMGENTELFPHLLPYMAHMRLTQQMHTAQLAKELDQCAQQLYSMLPTEPAVRTLAKIDQEIAIVERLFALELTPSEYLSFMSWQASATLKKRWAAHLRAQGIARAVVDGIASMDEAIPQLTKFYEVARQRNYVMTDITVKKMDEMEASVAILIAGGFHSPSLTQLLNEEGLQVVVIAPKVTEDTDEDLYHYMLKYKSGIVKEPPSEDLTHDDYAQR